MSNPRVFINKNNFNFSCQSTNAEYLGVIYPNELYIDCPFMYDSKSRNYAFTEVRGWTRCVVGDDIYDNFGGAFDKKYASFANSDIRYAFPVRRQCRIFRGETEIAKIYAGDMIETDGKSEVGYNYPYRLSINGYRKSGSWYHTGQLWCDLDLEIGYTTNPTVYSTKW